MVKEIELYNLSGIKWELCGLIARHYLKIVRANYQFQSSAIHAKLYAAAI